jgi:hypothetical protein
VIGGKLRPLRAPGFDDAEAAVQKDDRLALALDLISSPDAGKFYVLAHRSPPLIAALTLRTKSHPSRLLEPLFTGVRHSGE